MFRTAIYLLVVGLVALPATGTPAPKPTKKELIQAELASLEGTWKVVSFIRDGKEDPAAAALVSPIKVKGYDYLFPNGFTGKITDINPTASPKTVDYKNDGDENEFTVQLGIYKLDGDTYMDCVSLGGKERPKEFVAKEGSDHILVKYERVKEQRK